MNRRTSGSGPTGCNPVQTSRADASRYPPPPASSTMASLPISIAPALDSFVRNRCIIVEHLSRERPCAPRGNLPRDAEQIFRRKRNPL